MSNDNHKPSPIFIEGKITNLRPLSKADAPTIARWINDPKVREFVSATFPKNEQQEEEWINKLASDDKNIVFGIETKDGKFIGLMGIHSINWLYRHCTTGAIIGEKEYWGNGYGTDAKMHLLDYIFNTLNLHKVCSTVVGYNKRSLHYSLHCGYKVEGRKREQIFKDGKYWTQIELGLLKEYWLPIWRKYQKAGKVR